MNDFNAHALDAAAETLFGGWDAIEEVIDEVLDIHEESPDTKPADNANNTCPIMAIMP